MNEVDRTWVENLVKRNRFLVLATTNGSRPWATPLEYVVGDDLDLYYFSPAETRHSNDVETNPEAAVTIYDADQSDYTGQATFALGGVQVEATVERIDGPDYPKVAAETIERWSLPMPPYVCYRITGNRWYLPLIENGINLRVPIDMS